MIPLKKRTGSATSARTSSQNASASTVPSGVPSAEMPAAFAATLTATHGAGEFDDARGRRQPASERVSVRERKHEHLPPIFRELRRGHEELLHHLPGVDVPALDVLHHLARASVERVRRPPAAASFGRHGRSSTHEKRHDVTRVSSFSSHPVIFRSMSRIMPPRFPTFCLNRSTPSNATKGSLNSHFESYAASAPAPETKYFSS